jgi:hypothetical protein
MRYSEDIVAMDENYLFRRLGIPLEDVFLMHVLSCTPILSIG